MLELEYLSLDMVTAPLDFSSLQGGGGGDDATSMLLQMDDNINILRFDDCSRK